MENLKYPKKSYFIEDLGTDNFEKIGTNLVFKKEGVIIDSTTAANNIKHFTKDGASGARFLEFKSDATCYTECKYGFGFAIKREYENPGKLNEYPRNHMRSRPYYGTIAPVTITNGVIEDSNIRKMEKATLADIKADHYSNKEGDFFKAFKFAVASIKTATATITLDGVAHTGVVLDETHVNQIDGLVAIERHDGSVLIMATEDGSYFEFSSVADGTIDREGIMVVGTDPSINIFIHHADTMKVSFAELFVLTLPAVTSKSYNLRFLGDENLNVLKTFASASSFSLSDVDYSNKGDLLYITSGVKTLNEIVVLPGVAATALYPGAMLLASGNGSWPTMQKDKLRRRFIGYYKGRFGEEQFLPSAKRHVEMTFTKIIEKPSLSSGASEYAKQGVRISIVLPYDVYNTSDELIAL